LELFGRDTGVTRAFPSPALADVARTNAEALRAYLILVFVAHHQCEPGSRLGPLSDYLELLGSNTSRVSLQTILGWDTLSRRSTQVRLQRVLLALERLGLATIPLNRSRRSYASTCLLSEGRDGTPYALPGNPYANPFTMKPPRDCIYLPPALFLEGWIFGLSGPELAVLLFLIELRLRFRGGRDDRTFFITREARLAEYHISDETYSAYRGLCKLGVAAIAEGPRSYFAADGKMLGFHPIQFLLHFGALQRSAPNRIKSIGAHTFSTGELRTSPTTNPSDSRISALPERPQYLVRPAACLRVVARDLPPGEVHLRETPVSWVTASPAMPSTTSTMT
jgi:hypothetical protein